MNTQTITNYLFDIENNRIIILDKLIKLESIKLINNSTLATTIFDPSQSGLFGTVQYSNNSTILTFDYNISQMHSTDVLEIVVDEPLKRTASGALSVGNANKKVRDNFADGNSDNWDTILDTNDLIVFDGNSSGASYLGIVKSVFSGVNNTQLSSKLTFSFPFRFGFAPSLSQRMVGQEYSVSFISTKEDDSIDYMEQPDNINPISLSVTSNVATIVTDVPHKLAGGDRVILCNFADSRLNVGPVVVTPVTLTSFTIPLSIANGSSYNISGGIVKLADPLNNAKNGIGILYDNATATSAALIGRRNGKKFRNNPISTITTVANQVINNPYTDSFIASGENEIRANMEGISYLSRSPDTTSGPTYSAKVAQAIPDEYYNYKVQVRAKNLDNMTGIKCKILSMSKTGTITATVVTTEPHGLTVDSWIMCYGAKDLTNFPNLTTAVKVSSIIDSTTFTVVWGTATTNSSYGGIVVLINGSVPLLGVANTSVQSFSVSAGIMTIITGSTLPFSIGDYITVSGLVDPIYEGVYKIAKINSTTTEVYCNKPDKVSTVSGGAVVKNSMLRLHTLRMLDYNRQVVEIDSRGNNDMSSALPVMQLSSVTTPSTQSTGTNTTIWNSGGYSGLLVTDVSSASLTTTTTSTSVTPGAVANIGVYSNSFSVIVTSKSGTNSTLDVVVQESIDNGTNWRDVYHFPRITEIGNYTSPLIRAIYGTRYRYVQTVGGTTPSFTRSINRIQSTNNGQMYKNFINRTINPTVTESVTPSYEVDGCDQIQLVVYMGSSPSPVEFILEGSEDNLNYYELGRLPSKSNAVNQLTITNIIPRYVRARVSSGESNSVINYLQIKSIGR